MTVNENIQFFFTDPLSEDGTERRQGAVSTLYLLRREIQDCFRVNLPDRSKLLPETDVLKIPPCEMRRLFVATVQTMVKLARAISRSAASVSGSVEKRQLQCGTFGTR